VTTDSIGHPLGGVSVVAVNILEMVERIIVSPTVLKLTIELIEY
jgi:hypothetical protein